MDAVPVTLGQEFARLRRADPPRRQARAQRAAAGRADPARRHRHRHRPQHPPATSPARCARSWRPTPGSTIHPPEDPFEAQANRDALVELSGALKVIAVSLTKIADDLALIGSGPRVGIGEIYLPELQKGSSIMPGKVNPVMPEVVLQVSAQVIGNDTAITIGGMQGQFELNVRIPLIARNLLQSIELLSNASTLLAEKCVDGIEPNQEGLRALGRGHARRRHRAQPVHRLRQGGRDRQGRRRRAAARCARSRASTASTRRRSTRRSTCARSPPARRPTRERPREARRLAAVAARARAARLPAGADRRRRRARRRGRRDPGDRRRARVGPRRCSRRSSRSSARCCSAALRAEPLAAPAVAVAQVVRAVVQAVGAALPELDRLRAQQEAAPVLRARDVVAVLLAERLELARRAPRGRGSPCPAATPRRRAGSHAAREAK